MGKFGTEKVKSHFWFCGYGRCCGELPLIQLSLIFKKIYNIIIIENEIRNEGVNYERNA